MATEVILPMLGETMNEGTIVSWLKQEGEAVKPGDVLFTVESDKATLEVEAQTSGLLRKILAPAGLTVPVLSVVALITATLDESVCVPMGAPAPAHVPIWGSPLRPGGSAPPAVAEPAAPVGRLIASPRARRAARERGIDLSVLTGTGSGGRIVERDVTSTAVARPSTAGRITPIAKRVAAALMVDLSKVRGTGPGGRITRKDAERAAAATVPRLSSPAAIEPISRMQRLMAERMVASFTSAPHFYLHVEVQARWLLELRDELLSTIESTAGVRLTITDILVKLCALALVRHPRAMAQYTPEGLRLASAVNVGVAADTPHGLVVPVIREADGLGLAEIASKRTELIERARTGRSLLQDFEAGVFTLSNLGMFRVDSFDAILNPPQAAILAVGRIAERPVAEGGQLIVAPTMMVSLSVDHRVLDGARAARFLNDLVIMMERPSLALS
jgi:pyruvate dehydrogenase E2 component (dihydrolipoamide acetyltransferase)